MAWSDAARRAAAEARRRRAKLTYKPSTKAKQHLAADSERRIARIFKTVPTTNKAPFDTLFTHQGRLQSVEIKTLMDNKNDKITMHKDALLRKVRWALKNKSISHTVVFDRRGARPKMFYRRGVGSFRLSSLTAVKNASHLRSLIKEN
jgi:chromatin segregation and condensation protein Rec8/ScpA/Scc1 (kleisin family)